MPRDVPMPEASWHASLALAFERRAARTLLASRRHDGPLVVQKTFHPEGEAVCHAIVVHPPGGIAGGDQLEIDIEAGPGAHALLTTPGAGKWYRSSGPWASQRISIDVGPDAIVEWLPQETIVFDGALARLAFEANLDKTARLVAWDIACLGRTGAGERFARGTARLDLRVMRAGRALWIERGTLEPDCAALESSVGLGGRSVFGTLVVAGPDVDDAVLAACRALSPGEGEGAVTRMPSLMLARFRGESSEAARQYFTALWRVLRPSVAGRDAAEPRIWRT
jgi:urease accessory protein